MPAGRPRTVSFTPEEMISLGEEMCEWVAKNNPIHLSKWYCIEKDITDKDWDAMRKIPEFLHYYMKALKMVGYQYIDKDSTVDVRIKDRWQRVYFKDLKAEEDETKVFDSKLKAQADSDANAQFVAQHSAMMDYLQRMRELSKEEGQSASPNSSPAP